MTRNRKRKVDFLSLKAEYDRRYPAAIRLRDCILDQLSALFNQNNIALGVPMEARVKTWSSVEDKFGRKSAKSELDDITDLIGLRAILLFQRDLEIVDGLLKQSFSIISVEDTAERLDETQFGYQSQHYLVKILPSWLEVPSYSDLGELMAEIQVRTLAQHIWAAASHKLQYKRSESVPPPLRRTIHRVSALLETVDLEFSRVLEERQAYIAGQTTLTGEGARLNVDLVRLILDEKLPKNNRDEEQGEIYDKLLMNLMDFDIDTSDKLRVLIDKHREAILRADAKRVAEYSNKTINVPWVRRARIENGVFYTHVGLAREALSIEFGEDKVLESVLRTMDDGR